ncbi:MAG: Holliday junction branch migration protein RuvA, partial [bacterium]|nr:Holliday junction branch migration protein RuvA [bacterium]
MIVHIEGKVKMKGDKFLIIETNGIGYRVFVDSQTIKTSPSKEEEISLWTHLHVREDAMELYGFKEYAELEFFEMLIQISGIGPKSALGILSVAPLDTLKKAISSGETAYLTKVSGVGRKTAEKIILELRDKMGELSHAEGIVFREEQDVLEALQSLGYSKTEVREALKNLPAETKGTNNRIKEALK